MFLFLFSICSCFFFLRLIQPLLLRVFVSCRYPGWLSSVLVSSSSSSSRSAQVRYSRIKDDNTLLWLVVYCTRQQHHLITWFQNVAVSAVGRVAVVDQVQKSCKKSYNMLLAVSSKNLVYQQECLNHSLILSVLECIFNIAQPAGMKFKLLSAQFTVCTLQCKLLQNAWVPGSRSPIMFSVARPGQDNFSANTR